MDCDRCARRAWLRNRLAGKEQVCGHYYTAPPDPCPIFDPVPEPELCRRCEHSRWSRLGDPWCRHKKLAEDGTCLGFQERRPFAPPPCPTCGLPLSARGNELSCPTGHAWRARRSRSACPRCGERYLVFGIDSPTWPESYRDLYHVCPACGWNEVRKGVYIGPALGRGYRGQHWSPRTGRALALE